ncbi:Carbohydrate esterase 4 protein, partial [Haplosporangium sp. Z 27]
MTRSIFLAISTVIAMTSLTLLRPAHASPSFKRQNPNQVYSSCTIPGTAAITFEGGPYIYTTTAVNTLNNAGAKGTFFLARYNYECIYSEPGMDAVRSEYDGGHQVGLYTWSNADLTTLSGDEIQAELAN